MAWTFAVMFSLAATSISAEERPARSLSPDGKWEFRPAAAGEKGNNGGAFVIAKAGSQETSVALSEEAFGTFAGQAKILWAPDSKRFAFNYQPGIRYQTAQLYQLDGDKWRELDSPESDETTAPLERSEEAQKKKLKLSPKAEGRPIREGCQVRRWIDSSTALLYAYAHETFEINNEIEPVAADFFLTLKFDAAGNWEIIRTRELPAKGLEGLNKEEREEVDRLKKERE